MSFEEYQRAAERTAKIPFDLAEVALGLVGESGEVADEIKKRLYHGHPTDIEKLSEEIGDVLWYLAILAKALGLSLDDIAKGNITKLWRRYPTGFDSLRSINRED